MTDNEDTLHDRIAERAHELWEDAGRPHERSVEFWHQAREEIAPDVKEEGAQEFSDCGL